MNVGRLLAWLSGPASGSAEHHLSMWAAWHGRLMVLAWGVILPLGIIIARYFKVTRSQNWPSELDNQFWWMWHKRLQYTGVLITLVGIYPAYRVARGGSAISVLHAAVGWTVVSIGFLQITSGLLRGTKGGPTGERSAELDWSGDHYDMTLRRVVFEYVHKFGGLLSLVIAAAAIMLGLVTADAPRWMFLVIFGWWVVLIAVAIRLQLRGRCVDTYQAIWGTASSLPGNQRKPIGIGVRMLKDDEHTLP